MTVQAVLLNFLSTKLGEGRGRDSYPPAAICRSNLFDEMGFDLQHLNDKLFPFLEFNQWRFPGLMAQNCLDLEALMFRMNAQTVRGIFDIGGESRMPNMFRKTITLS